MLLAELGQQTTRLVDQFPPCIKILCIIFKLGIYILCMSHQLCFSSEYWRVMYQIGRREEKQKNFGALQNQVVVLDFSLASVYCLCGYSKKLP